MSCDDCFKQLAQKRSFQTSLLNRLTLAAQAHGYELWIRPGDTQMEVLALPLAPQHGTPKDLVDAFKEQGLPLAGSPLKRKAMLAHAKTATADRTSTPGREKWLIQGQPDILLHFKT